MEAGKRVCQPFAWGVREGGRFGHAPVPFRCPERAAYMFIVNLLLRSRAYSRMLIHFPLRKRIKVSTNRRAWSKKVPSHAPMSPTPRG